MDMERRLLTTDERARHGLLQHDSLGAGAAQHVCEWHGWNPCTDMEAQMIGEVSDEAGISTIHQACAVPFRRRKRKVEFCVITSSRGRWLFPKGCIGRGASVPETALKEAYEEAGLHGRIIGDPLGCYIIARDGAQLSITALLMEVDNSDRRWPEGSSRRRRWVTPGKARRVLSQSQLTEILGAAVARLKGDAASDESPASATDEVRIG